VDSTTSTDEHRRHLGVLARIMLGGHLDGIHITALSTNGLANIHTGSPDDAQTVAGRLGITAHTDHNNHHRWTGDWRGDRVEVVAIGELTHPEPDAHENDDALTALAGVTVMTASKGDANGSVTS